MGSFRRRKLWVIVLIALSVLALGLFIAGILLSRHFEPFVRQKTVAWLSERFRSDVTFEALKVSMPLGSPAELLLGGGKGAIIRVTGGGLKLKRKDSPGLPPMFVMKAFSADVDFRSLFERPTRVPKVVLTGMEINIPPRKPKPQVTAAEARKLKPTPPSPEELPPPVPPPDPNYVPLVVVDTIVADGTRLAILPRDPAKEPQIYQIHKLSLTSAAAKSPMDYDAQLTVAKPPGFVHSKGYFGPFDSGEPGNSPLGGTYVFANADLGVFKGISGTLASAGKFSGQLDYILVDGDARVPNFAIDSGGHPMFLETRFHTIVDGTNGNTTLDPVDARLGQTRFTCKGFVSGRPGVRGKWIDLDISMPSGRLEDVLFLAMKGDRPFMKGGINLAAKLFIPPGEGRIAQRLSVKGKFALVAAHFTSSTVQEKIDGFSRSGQGKPGDSTIRDVPVAMSGNINLGEGSIRLDPVLFEIPGAELKLSGAYSFLSDQMDFLGAVRLKARISQAVGGWKGALLTPADPFFAKRGAGTYLPIRISGSREKPEFGLTKTDKVDARLQK